MTLYIYTIENKLNQKYLIHEYGMPYTNHTLCFEVSFFDMQSLHCFSCHALLFFWFYRLTTFRPAFTWTSQRSDFHSIYHLIHKYFVYALHLVNTSIFFWDNVSKITINRDSTWYVCISHRSLYYKHKGFCLTAYNKK